MANTISFNKLIIKNFLSFGNEPTNINLTGDYVTVVMGINHDTGGDESRNGTGKSAILDAISYVLFGKTIRGISNAKLVNKMMRKGQGMLVTLEIDTPKYSYRIERGESPSKLKLYRKDIDDNNDFLLRDGKSFVYDVSRNKNETTAEIEGILGFDIKLFEFLVANTTESIPYMKLPEDKRREIAERLMALNQLTERAEELKEERKVKKKDLVSQESALEATKQANDRIEKQIDDLNFKEKSWERKRTNDIAVLRDQIKSIAGINIDEQIELIEMLDELESEDKRISAARKNINMEVRAAQRDIKDLTNRINDNTKQQQSLEKAQAKIEDSECPTCGQHWQPDPSVLERVIMDITTLTDDTKEAEGLLVDVEKEEVKIQDRVKELDNEEAELAETADELSEIELLFDNIQEASKAVTLVETNEAQIKALEETDNPHTDTIKSLRENAMTEVDDGEVKELRTLIDHYNYLIELLQSKDSFLRKAVIERWLPKLNGQIATYLEKLELPFTVRIENDLSMGIKAFGEEFDWGNLSKGQRQRVTIALNLAFQDLFEATNNPLSLLLADEIIDSGMCSRGATQAVETLKSISERKGKRIFLVTHREDISDQVDDNILVELKNRISRIHDYEMEEMD